MFCYKYTLGIQNIFLKNNLKIPLKCKSNFLIKAFLVLPKKEIRSPCYLQSCRYYRATSTVYKSESNRELVLHSYFNQKEKNRKTFVEAIRNYRERERFLRGHVEFINSALKYMEEFGVHKDVEVYKKLMDIMPKGKMIPTNIFQEEFHHYPKHQDCGVDLLQQMEKYGIMPDKEMRAMLRNIFGRKGKPVLKAARMIYWMPKLKGACPWPLPFELPDSALELAKLAILQINSVDPASEMTIMQTKDVEDSVDDTWIVSAISPFQRELIAKHPKEKSIKVEGPFGVFLRDERISYFILRADPTPPSKRPKRSETDDVSSIFVWMAQEGKKKERELIKVRTVHEQEDGTILATCATGTSSRDSLLSWIRLLEKSVPDLSGIPVLFTQSSPIGEVIVATEEAASSTESLEEASAATEDT